ncbi:MAG: hypothetical protein ABW318_22075 [Vicinamibacterales bacterium]
MTSHRDRGSSRPARARRGIPLVQNGKIIGAIGATAGTPDQDGVIAMAGVDGMK